jgi:hypothetical protein
VTAVVPERGRFADEDANRAWGWGQGQPPEVPYVPPVRAPEPAPQREVLLSGVELTLDPALAAAHPALVDALREAARAVVQPDRKLRLASRK